jgi:hypothetical protein
LRSRIFPNPHDLQTAVDIEAFTGGVRDLDDRARSCSQARSREATQIFPAMNQKLTIFSNTSDIATIAAMARYLYRAKMRQAVTLPVESDRPDINANIGMCRSASMSPKLKYGIFVLTAGIWMNGLIDQFGSLTSTGTYLGISALMVAIARL